MNFYELCRLCANEVGDEGHNCRNHDGLLQTIKDLYGVEIRPDDEVSTKICLSCLKDVFHFEGHYRKVQIAQTQFSKYQQMVKTMVDRGTKPMQITANNQVYRLNRDSIQNPKSSRTIICEPSDSLTTNVKTEKSADGTIITIGERSKSTATSAEEMLNTQQYGTLTITAINGGQAMGKRTFDHIVDSDVQKNLPVMQCFKIRKVDNGTTTKLLFNNSANCNDDNGLSLADKVSTSTGSSSKATIDDTPKSIKVDNVSESAQIPESEPIEPQQMIEISDGPRIANVRSLRSRNSDEAASRGARKSSVTDRKAKKIIRKINAAQN